MGLRSYLLAPREIARKPASEAPNEAVREIEARAMVLVCKLCDETSKASPDAAVVGCVLDDLDVLASEYRREKTRKR